MASRQQRFEGPELEPVLERVRARYGDRAHIVAANRVRRGGVGGFFAREYYEVVVDEHADPAFDVATPALVVDVRDEPEPLTLPARSVLDLAEAINGTERSRQHPAATAADARYDDEVSRNVEGEVIDLDSDAPSADDSQRFVQILDRIARDVDNRRSTQPHRPLNNPVATQPTAGASATPMTTLRDDGTHDFSRVFDSDRRAPIVDPPARSRESGGTREFGGAHEFAGDQGSQAHAPRGTHSPADDGRIMGHTIGLRADVAVEEDRFIRGLAPIATPFVPPRVRRRRDLEVIERPENLLLQMGLPARFIPRGIIGNELRGALIESLSQLPVPSPLPDANGVVIAVIGVGAQPVVLARALAVERGLDPDNLVLATEHELGDGIPTWLQINDPATAEERRRSWRRRDYQTFVAISLTAVTSSQEWARSMLDNLEPTQTWGIVNAAWKIEDVDTWSERLGGFDVLALEHLADTVSPASPIQLDLPIARLDGRPATPLRWAELLTERMARR